MLQKVLIKFFILQDQQNFARLSETVSLGGIYKKSVGRTTKLKHVLALDDK